MKKRKIPNGAIRRLPLYYRHLESMQKQEVHCVSSAALAAHTGSTASQIRQDLSYFGEFGRQGYGYAVETLKNELAEILGMNNGYTAVVLGAGRLAKAMVANFPFEKYGIRLMDIYDIDPEKVGTDMFGFEIHHIDQLPIHLAEHPADIGILTVSAEAAGELADTLGGLGVKGIWNYTNVELHPRSGSPVIENVHFFDSLFSLCCKINGYYRW